MQIALSMTGAIINISMINFIAKKIAYLLIESENIKFLQDNIFLH